ncbi:unnamed protein product [Rhizophagus irregularis]|nr:unnamed protein product [Rhizophagus irregularis]
MMHFIGANGDRHYFDYAFCETEKDREVPKIPNVPIGINIQIQSIKTTISDKDDFLYVKKAGRTIYLTEGLALRVFDLDNQVFSEYGIRVPQYSMMGEVCFAGHLTHKSLHYIMLIDLTRMKRPTYITVDKRSWRASIRQPVQPDLASFFGDIMNEYEKVINDIDELRLKFYEMWGKYCDKVIYSDEKDVFLDDSNCGTRIL